MSFGHMHDDDLGLTRSVATAHRQAASTATHRPQAPADRHQQPASDDDCPICASMALLATGVPALAPVLVNPAPLRRVWLPVMAVQSSPKRFLGSFQARAPPIA
jgi:hypothetical protein